MNQTVRITEVIPPAEGTRQPWRFKDATGTKYATFDVALAHRIQPHIGQPLGIEYQSEERKGFTNLILTGIAPASGIAAPEAQPAAKTNGSTGTGWRPDPSRDMKESEKNAYIIRESCLSSAVALVVGMVRRNEKELTDQEEQQIIHGTIALADKFVGWVYNAGPKNSGKVQEAVEQVQAVFPDAQVVGTGMVGPKSRAS